VEHRGLQQVDVDDFEECDLQLPDDFDDALVVLEPEFSSTWALEHDFHSK
jgi:hypothetical protein